MSRSMPWVQRHPRRPDACPQCERLCKYTDHWGPRTTGRCYLCGLRWRMGNRAYPWRTLRRLGQRLIQHRPDVYTRRGRSGVRRIIG